LNIVVKQNEDRLRACFAENSQLLLPMLDLIQNTRTSIDELMYEVGRSLQSENPDASASLLERLEETFTVNELGLTPALMRGLSTANIIENPNGAVRRVAAV
jgi:hypothetical protein